MTAYMFRLYLEWGRLVHPDRGSGAMDFKWDEVLGGEEGGEEMVREGP